MSIHTASSDLRAFAKKPLNRRSFLGFVGAGAAAATLAGCSTGTASSSGGVFTAADIAGVIPNYYPVDYAVPDIVSVAGSTAGFLTLPATLRKSVEKIPGSGGSYTALSPAWWTIPSANNSYFKAVNKELGTDVKFQVSDGNTYGEKIQAVLASPNNVPDMVVIPSWNLPPKFDQAVGSLFADLSPFLAGDKVKDYPNLANIPTDSWKYSVFQGKLYGLPYPGEVIQNAFFYRKDIFDELGLQLPTDADSFIDILADATDPSKNRWGSDDLWNAGQIMFGVPDKWIEIDGKLVHKFETEQFRAALDWLTRLYKSGAVHPDAMAGNDQQANSRYEAGNTLVKSDGVGGWAESLARVLPSNPSYNTQAMDYFAADGGDPVLYKGSPASIFSFINKKSDEAAIKEMLAVANFAAAPFGTAEYQLLNSGVKGTHYDLDANGAPVLNEKGQAEVTSTYSFLVHPPVVQAHVEYPQFVTDYCNWSARMSAFATDPVLYGVQIQEPAKFGSLGTPFDDLKADVANGRKDLSALDGAIKTWKSKGGDELRKFYQKYLDA
jgi:putative aldouronate transport system substrate-binding protein